MFYLLSVAAVSIAAESATEAEYENNDNNPYPDFIRSETKESACICISHFIYLLPNNLSHSFWHFLQ